ncbi:MAG: LuxR C-terminal-related transcriptional regulator [Thermomicrobiales bacterium]
MSEAFATNHPLIDTSATTPLDGRLPTLLTSFIGREREVDQVGSLVRRDDIRLVTLTGPGGVGKTRLAIAVANHLARERCDSIAFVGLAPVRRADRVAAAIAQALGISLTDDGPLPVALVNALGDRPLLLVLDNFEHVLPAAPLLADLLATPAGLTILVTSRTPLHISGEQEYPVPPLALPAADAATSGVADAPAVQLFVARAAAVDPTFAVNDDNAGAIAAICARLDGLPLAIELAAARSKVLPPAILLPRLARRLPLLTNGPHDAPARLQTMQEAITWSHDLLPEEERVLFRRLAVFVGGFDLAAAEAVCTGMAPARMTAAPPGLSFLDQFTSLVDKSLIQASPGSIRGPRFTLLETIREFALERLEAAGEGDRARAAHADYFVSLDGRLDPNLTAPGERVDERLWEIEADYPNFRAALVHLAQTNQAERVERLAGALSIYYHHRGDLAEGRHWVSWGLDNSPEKLSPWRVRALNGLSLIVWSQGESALAAELAESAQVMAEILDDRDQIALAVHLRGIAALTQGQLGLARDLMERTLRLQRELALPSQGAMATRVLGVVAYAAGDLDGCAQHAESALAAFRTIGNPSGAAGAIELLGRVAHGRDDDRTAAAHYQDALHLWTMIDARWSTAGVHPIAPEATGFPRWAGIDDRRMILSAMSGLATIAAQHAQQRQSAVLLGAVDRRRETLSTHVSPSLTAHLERTRVSMRAALGPVEFATQYAAGQRLRLADAVALAMSIRAGAPPHHATTGHPLTARQLEILRLVVAGSTDREIAETLFIGHRTAQDHVSNLIGKLGVANRTEAAAFAVREGLV